MAQSDASQSEHSVRDNRGRILDAAEVLFAEKGFAGTSVREILRRAEVSNPMLYYYFGSKRELLRTLLNERFAEFSLEVDSLLSRQTTAEGVLRAYAEDVFRRLGWQLATMRLFLGVFHGGSPSLSGEELWSLRNGFQRLLSRHLERTAPDQSEAKIAFVIMLYHGMLTPFLTHSMLGWVDGLPGDVAETLARRGVAVLHDETPLPQGLADALVGRYGEGEE